MQSFIYLFCVPVCVCVICNISRLYASLFRVVQSTLGCYFHSYIQISTNIIAYFASNLPHRSLFPLRSPSLGSSAIFLLLSTINDGKAVECSCTTAMLVTAVCDRAALKFSQCKCKETKYETINLRCSTVIIFASLHQKYLSW